MKLIEIKTAIKRQTEKSLEINKKAACVSGMSKHFLHLEKRDIGRKTRLLLLTYGFLRNKPYKTIEKNAKTIPSSLIISKNLESFLGIPISIEEINQWISGIEVVHECGAEA